MSDCSLRSLSFDEMRTLYDQDLARQFPADEIRPWESIERLTRRGVYSGVALIEENRIVGYAFMLSAEENVLIDYLAVPDPWKNRGYGSLLLNRLRSLYRDKKQTLVESEDPAALEGEQARAAGRRLVFYARNGFFDTSVRVVLFGVDYRILSDRACPDVGEVRAGIEAIYRSSIPASIRPAAVRFHG